MLRRRVWVRPRSPLLGLPGMRVLAVSEFVDERHVFVETAADRVFCRSRGQRAGRVAGMGSRCVICPPSGRRPGWFGLNASGGVFLGALGFAAIRREGAG